MYFVLVCKFPSIVMGLFIFLSKTLCDRKILIILICILATVTHVKITFIDFNK